MTPSKATGRHKFSIDQRIKLDPEDLDRLRAIGRSVFVSEGYAYFNIGGGRLASVQQLILDRIGQGNDGLRIDHINGDKLDNRRVNLRLVPDQVNQINRKHLNRNNKSGYRGVSFAPRLNKSRPWRATITVDYKSIHLGMFTTREEAHTARRAAEANYYPEACPLPQAEAS